MKSTNTNHIPELTSLRFVAALLVLLMHFSVFTPLPNAIIPIIQSGGIGVTFFFTLSGFLLYTRYSKYFEKSFEKSKLKTYLLARFFRLYPAYFMALIATTAIIILTNPTPPTSQFIAGWLANLFGIQTFSPNLITQQYWNAPGWSVSTEFFFYLSFPFFLHYISNNVNTQGKAIAAIIAFTTIWIALRLGIVVSFHGTPKQVFWVDYVSDRNILWRFWEFAIGSTFAKYTTSLNSNWLQEKSQRNIAIIAATFSILLIAYTPSPTDSAQALAFRTLRLAILNTIPFAILISAASQGDSILTPILSRKLMVFLGECSYGVYIYHWMFWVYLDNTRQAGFSISPTMAWIAMGLVLIVAILSFVLIERPIQNWSKIYFRSQHKKMVNDHSS